MLPLRPAQTLAEKTRIVVPVEDAPTSAAKRVTLSVPVVNAAARVVFSAVGAKLARPSRRRSCVCVCRCFLVAYLASGAGLTTPTRSPCMQASTVQRVLEYQALPGALPAQLVRPDTGVTWVLDKEAGKYLRPQIWAEPAKFPRSEIPAPAK